MKAWILLVVHATISSARLVSAEDAIAMTGGGGAPSPRLPNSGNERRKEDSDTAPTCESTESSEDCREAMSATKEDVLQGGETDAAVNTYSDELQYDR